MFTWFYVFKVSHNTQELYKEKKKKSVPHSLALNYSTSQRKSRFGSSSHQATRQEETVPVSTGVAWIVNQMLGATMLV